ERVGRARRVDQQARLLLGEHASGRAQRVDHVLHRTSISARAYQITRVSRPSSTGLAVVHRSTIDGGAMSWGRGTVGPLPTRGGALPTLPTALRERPHPLVVTADPDLLDDVLRLAAACSAEVRV